MNASLWQLAGWTMIHSLWLGAAVALAGGFFRLAARRAASNARYAISLATLALLAATPIAAATWLGINGVPQLAITNPASASLPLPPGEGWGEGQRQVHALPINAIEPQAPLAQSTNEATPLPPQVIDLAQATPTELEALTTQQTTSAPPLPPSPLPIPPIDHQSLVTSDSFPTYSPTHLLTSSLTTAIPHLPTLWLIGAPLTFTLLATGLVGSARLRRRATPLLNGPAYEACERLRQTLNITRRVALAVSDGVAQPILVGVLRPLILLPAAALAGWTPEQLDMVLLHELAHVRRRDNLVNLLQRIVESILFFHPAVWLVSRQVRRDREECCDAAVIRHTDRPHQYAELLVSIAAALRGGPAPSLAVASAMASHPLAGRIRRILNIEEEPMRITRRTLAATLLLPALLAGAMLYSGAKAEDAGNPPPSQEESSTLATDTPVQGSSDEGLEKEDLPTASVVDEPALQDEIARLELQVTQSKKEIAQLTLLDKIARSVKDARPHLDFYIREVSHLDPAVETASKHLEKINEQLQSMAYGTAPIDNDEVRRLQRRRAETADQLNNAREQFVQEQIALLSRLSDKELRDTTTERTRRLAEATKELETYQVDLQLARVIAKQHAHPVKDTAAASVAPAPNASANVGTPRNTAEIPLLQDEIRNLESLILKSKKDMAELQTFKELALQSGQGKAAIEAAVAAELDKDPTVKLYQQNLESMHSSLKEKISTAKNPNGADIQRARATIQQSEAQLAQYRQDAEKSIREQVAKLPNEALRDALTEYNTRYRAINDSIAKYQQQLEAAKTKLLQLGTNPAAPAPQPAPLLDRLEQLRLAFDQQRPLFSKQPDEQLQKVRYDGANLPEIVDDHWHYLVKGIANEPGKPSITFNWFRRGGKQYEIEVPAAAHEKLFRPLFDGHLPTADMNAAAPANQTPPATERSDKTAQTLFKKQDLPLTTEGSALNVAQDRANERLAIERAIRKSAPGGSIELIQAELATDRSLLEVERDLKNLERKTQSQFPEIESPGGRAASAETKARLAAIREQLKQERGTGAAVAPAATVPKSEAPAKPASEMSAEELKQKLVESRRRLENQLNELKKSSGKTIAPTQAEVEIAAELQQRVQEWQKANDARVKERATPRPAPPNEHANASGSDVPSQDTNPDASLQDIIVHFPPNFPNSDQERERIRESLAADGFKASSTTLRVGTTSAVTGEAETQLIPCLRVFVPKDWKAKPVWETKVDANGTPQMVVRLINEQSDPSHAPVDPVKPANPYSSSSAAPIQSSKQPAPPAPTEDESPTLAEFLKVFAVQADNPVVTREFHTAADRRSIDLLLHSIGGHPNAQNVELEWKWLDNGQLELTAPEQAHAILRKDIPDNLLQYIQERFSPFPTLENQKIADRAYKLLGLELDPLAPEEFKRVKKLGYTGGLRVARANQKAGTEWGDLLVGLHVWPVTDLKSLDQVLQRDDLGELNPLKYYVIRKKVSGGFGPSSSGEDAVVTGRLQIPEAELLSRGLEQTDQAMSQLAATTPIVDVAPADAAGDVHAYVDHQQQTPLSPTKLKPGDSVILNVAGAFPEAPLDGAFRVEPQGTLPLGPTYGRVAVAGKTVLEAEAAVQAHLGTILTDAKTQLTLGDFPAPDGAPTFLYDGKTFEEWRDLWKLELNPERRTEAINALAAFGRTGRGQEAADAILEVAGEYSDKYGRGSPEGQLLLAVLTAVSRMPAEQWMPQVQQRIAAANGPEKAIWIQHAARFLGASDDRSDEGRRHAAKFADLDSDELVTAAALYLLRSDPGLAQPETVALLRRAFQQKSPGISVLSLGFRHLDKVPEQLDLLVRDAGVRSALYARSAANDGEMAARLYPPLLEMLKDPNRAEDRIGVLRALRAIGPVVRNNEPLDNRRQITNELTELLRTAPDDLLPAVLVTFSKYWGSPDYNAILASLLEQGQLPAERIKHLRDLDEQAMFEEAHAQ